MADTPRWLEYQPLHELVPDERNPKAHSISNLRESLGRFGYTAPIEVDERTGKLVAGHGRRELLLDDFSLGRALPEGLVLRDDGEWLVPVVRGWSSDDDDAAFAYLVAANRQVELGGWDYEQLVPSLEALDEDLLPATGYSRYDLDELIARNDADADAEPQPQPEGTFGYVERYGEDDIVERAVEHYKQAGFPYPSTPLHEKLWQIERLARTEWAELQGTLVAHGVADEYHPHRYDVVIAGKKRSPLGAFNDTKLLRRSLRMALEDGKISDAALRNVLAYVDWTQAAANFRPGFTLRLLREFCPPDGVMLDTSLGFGGRLVGFAASHAGRYVGIDPSSETIEGNRRLADDLGIADRVELHQVPAEDVDPSLLPPADFAFTSPPYFSKERYSDEDTQSWVRYKQPETWRDGFLRPMLALQFAVLRSGAVAAVNVADVEVKGTQVPLVEWTAEAGKLAGFERISSTLTYGLSRVPGQGRRDDWGEPVLLFRKP